MGEIVIIKTSNSDMLQLQTISVECGSYFLYCQYKCSLIRIIECKSKTIPGPADYKICWHHRILSTQQMDVLSRSRMAPTFACIWAVNIYKNNTDVEPDTHTVTQTCRLTAISPLPT